MQTELRDQIRQEITAIPVGDTKEQAAITDALAWIDSGAELFRLQKPATPPKHLVSYFLLMDGDYVLLVDHKLAGLWLPSGGHVELNEHPRTTVEREILEELGIPAKFAFEAPQFLTITETVGQTAGHWDVSLWYVVLGDRYQPISFDETEFNTVQWFHRDDVPKDRVEPELARFLAKLPRL